MAETFFVMTGGAIGAGLRFHVARAIGGLFSVEWPTGTLAVNVIGGLLMGILAGTLDRNGHAEGWRLFLGVGILGGFTTFSAFSLEVVRLLQSGRWLESTGYIAASVIGSVAALVAGLALVRA